VEEAPGDGAYLVEEVQSVFSAVGVDRACMDEETKMGVDLFG
jgi:hypothetical protein